MADLVGQEGQLLHAALLALVAGRAEIGIAVKSASLCGVGSTNQPQPAALSSSQMARPRPSAGAVPGR
jgi:hypothetical protein